MKNKGFTLLVLLASAALALSACASGGSSASLAGTSWTLISYGPANGQVPAVSGTQTSINFSTDGQMDGNVGCNSFGGGYEVKDGQIIFQPVMSTMMACLGSGIMEQESGVLKVLQGTVSYELQGSSLTIHAASGDEIVKLAAAGNK